MKKRQLLATLLALVLMVSALPITASAYYCESVSISVDGIFIDDVDAYLDDDNCVRVSTSEDLLRIFPRELDDTVIAYDPWDGIVVEDYVNDFGYESHLKVSYDNGKYFCYTLYIYTDTNNSCGDYWSGTDWKYPEVYINGIYTPMSDIYQYWNIDFSKYSTTIFSGNRVYLNNDGNSPVEVVVNGHLIHFPDQQPIIIAPGRTMVLQSRLGHQAELCRYHPGKQHYVYLPWQHQLSVQRQILYYGCSARSTEWKDYGSSSLRRRSFWIHCQFP